LRTQWCRTGVSPTKAYASCLASPDLSPDREGLSCSCVLSRGLTPETLASLLAWDASPSGLPPSPAGPLELTTRADWLDRNPTRDPLMSFRSTSEYNQANCGRASKSYGTRTRRQRPTTPNSAASSHEVCCPYSVSSTEQRLRAGRVPPHPTPAPSGFLNLLTPSSARSRLALLHARSAHGVLPLQSCFPSAQVPTVSSPQPLLPLEEPQRPVQHRPKCRGASAKAEDSTLVDKPSGAPSTSGSCSTRRSDTLNRRFRPAESRCSPEAFAPPGCSPSSAAPRPSPGAPLLRLPQPGAKAAGHSPLQGMTAEEIGLPLARLPTLLGFVAL
jgi:hypothetical protein